MGNIESKLFESCIRIRSTTEGYEITVKIESTLADRPIWVEKKKTFFEFPESFDDIVREAQAEFNERFNE